METSRACFLSVSVVVAASMLSGCGRGPDKPVTITYSQIGMCKGFETASSPMTAKEGDVYAFFKFETVENPSSKTFYFDPKLLYVDQSSPEEKAKQVWEWNRRFSSTDSRFPQNLGIKMASESPVPPGGKADVTSIVVIPLGVDNPSRGPDADKHAFNIDYDSMTSENTASGEVRVSEGIVFNKKNASEKTWTVVENCKNLNLK